MLEDGRAIAVQVFRRDERNGCVGQETREAGVTCGPWQDVAEQPRA